MLQEQMTKAGLNRRIPHCRAYLSRDVVGAAPARLLANGFLMNHFVGHVKIQWHTV
jgi:hypothetical protein